MQTEVDKWKSLSETTKKILSKTPKKAGEVYIGNFIAKTYNKMLKLGTEVKIVNVSFNENVLLNKVGKVLSFEWQSFDEVTWYLVYLVQVPGGENHLLYQNQLEVL